MAIVYQILGMLFQAALKEFVDELAKALNRPSAVTVPEAHPTLSSTDPTDDAFGVPGVTPAT